MSGHGRAATGMSAIVLLCVPGGAQAATARVVEAEAMRPSAGAAVRGDVLVLRSGGAARTRVVVPALRAVAIRTRATRCAGQAPLRIWIGARRTVRAGRRWASPRAAVRVPAGTYTLRLARPAGRRRCRVAVDRIRLIEAPTPAVPRPPEGGPLRRLPLGTAVDEHHLRNDLLYEAALRREFDSITPENEMKMTRLQPQPGKWAFAAADRLVGYAQATGKDVRGHALVFGKQTPRWVSSLLFAADVRAAMRRHITTVMARYRGRVSTWDVVNEAIGPTGDYHRNVWFTKLGPQYVDLAFLYARRADPSASLIYNEFDAETEGPKRAAVLRLVERLRTKGLIDGVGLQVHTGLLRAPSKDELVETMRRYESLGLRVEVTEMDVLAKGEGTPESLTDRLAGQAAIYRDAATACAEVAACSRFTVWGVSDRYSWLGVDQLPLLLDAEFRPKPALAAVRDVIG